MANGAIARNGGQQYVAGFLVGFSTSALIYSAEQFHYPGEPGFHLVIRGSRITPFDFWALGGIASFPFIIDFFTQWMKVGQDFLSAAWGVFDGWGCS